MNDYIDIAERNGILLKNTGICQFCGAQTERGIHECVEIFSLGFQLIDYSNPENHIYRFLSVDAHTLQHPEIHGRWNNHFHLTRLHLIFKYNVKWNYQLSPKLSNTLNRLKKHRANEILIAPPAEMRGKTNTTTIQNKSVTETDCKKLIFKWAKEVYDLWEAYHATVDPIAKEFLR